MSNEGTSSGSSRGTSSTSRKEIVSEVVSTCGKFPAIQELDSSRRQVYARVKFLLYVEIGEDSLQLENHMKRLQNLRQELYYIKKTDWQYEPIDKLIGQSTVEMVIDFAWRRFRINKREVYEKKLDAVLKDLFDDGDEEEKTNEEEEKEMKYLEQLKRSGKCVKKAGMITKLMAEYGMIDNRYKFDRMLVKDFPQITEGCRVSYLCYREENDVTKVVRIETILEESWDKRALHFDYESAIDRDIEEHFGTHTRRFTGTVVSVCDSPGSTIINIETETESNVSIDISTIQINFQPAAGDKIIVTCKVQTNEDFVNFTGAILNYSRIMAVRANVDVGTVTVVFPSGGGRINKNIAFMPNALEQDYAPQVGDVVAFEAIENYNNECEWRCLKMVLTKRTEQKSREEHPVQDHQTPERRVDERGIVVEAIPQIYVADVGERTQFDIKIRNTHSQRHKLLKTIIPVARKLSQLEVLTPHVDAQLFFPPGHEEIFRMEAVGKLCGYTAEKIVWRFGGGFSVERKILIQVGAEDVDARPREMFRQFQPRHGFRNGFNLDDFDRSDADVIRGGALMKHSGIAPKIIDQHLVPTHLKKLIVQAKNKMEAEARVMQAYPVLGQNLEPRTYTGLFHNLIYIEEIQLWVDFRIYDRSQVFFRRPDKEYLSLEIDNVAETRPSLILGDIIRVTNPYNTQRVYEGHVHKIMPDSVWVKFEKNFQNSYNGEKYNVEFLFSRGNFRKLHHAVGHILPHLGERVIFPTKIEPRPPQIDVILNEQGDMVDRTSGKELKWFNPKLNEAQRRAVRNVLRGEARPMPYVIFGPPGTGKTYTVLELILQIAKNIPHSRLIVCASSNSAANLITERLISCGDLVAGDFIRVVGLSAIDRHSIPDHLHPYCGLCDVSIEGTTSNEIRETEKGLKMHCNTKYLAQHKIIIGTCQALGSFMAMRFRPNHFTHVIIDEAGQCNEPETVIPLCLISPDMGQIVLAGDPRQLGPQIISTIAKDHGLGVSLLDRLLERFPYEKNYQRYEHGFDERLVTKLIYNYRSLPSVLRLYSDLFYDGKLVPTINETDSDEMQFLKKYRDLLPEAKSATHGVFFMSVVGDNKQDDESPSWYNAVEAKNVYYFILKLYKLGIRHSDIGVITPYKAQVKRIRVLLHHMEEEKIPKVGSVEEFQGQERNIIIVSTVRSSRTLLAHDLKHSMGFVQNNKRLNVAISRAKSMLVIFGNAQLLANDPNWCRVIKYTAERDAFHGEIPAQVASMNI